jgi:hypothetical protein
MSRSPTKAIAAVTVAAATTAVSSPFRGSRRLPRPCGLSGAAAGGGGAAGPGPAGRTLAFFSPTGATSSARLPMAGAGNTRLAGAGAALTGRP